MAQKTLQVTLEDGIHTITYASNRSERIITVDRQTAYVGGKGEHNFGGYYPIKIGKHACILKVSLNGFSHQYKVLVDETEIPDTPKTPWVWLFVAGCLLMVIVAGGGAIEGGIAGGCAAGCYMVARSVNDQPMLERIIICAIIMVLCWLSYFGLIAVLVRR